MYYTRKFYRLLRFIFYKLARIYSWLITCIKFRLNGVKFNHDFIGYGIPLMDVKMDGEFSIGKKFRFNSGKYFGMWGRQQQCCFIVGSGAQLQIGDDVGISSVAIVCHKQVTIGSHVKLGINTVIYDTDFHSLDARMRNAYPERLEGVRTKAVIIKEGAFIGGHTTILKGVTIGKNAIVGAGSVVFDSIPDEQVWIGNPARYVKETSTSKKGQLYD